MNWLKVFLNRHPIILALLFLAFIGWLIWWLNQPIEVIYDPNAPPLPWAFGGDDYH